MYIHEISLSLHSSPTLLLLASSQKRHTSALASFLFSLLVVSLSCYYLTFSRSIVSLLRGKTIGGNEEDLANSLDKTTIHWSWVCMRLTVYLCVFMLQLFVIASLLHGSFYFGHKSSRQLFWYHWYLVIFEGKET